MSVTGVVVVCKLDAQAERDTTACAPTVAPATETEPHTQPTVLKDGYSPSWPRRLHSMDAARRTPPRFCKAAAKGESSTILGLQTRVGVRLQPAPAAAPSDQPYHPGLSRLVCSSQSSRLWSRDPDCFGTDRSSRRSAWPAAIGGQNKCAYKVVGPLAISLSPQQPFSSSPMYDRAESRGMEKKEDLDGRCIVSLGPQSHSAVRQRTGSRLSRGTDPPREDRPFQPRFSLQEIVLAQTGQACRDSPVQIRLASLARNFGERMNDPHGSRARCFSQVQCVRTAQKHRSTLRRDDPCPPQRFSTIPVGSQIQCLGLGACAQQTARALAQTVSATQIQISGKLRLNVNGMWCTH